jgi:hypothetical protein
MLLLYIIFTFIMIICIALLINLTFSSLDQGAIIITFQKSLIIPGGKYFISSLKTGIASLASNIITG